VSFSSECRKVVIQLSAQLSDLLRSFGWRTIVDLGDISGARGVEMLLPLWLRLMGTFKTATFNFHVART